MNGKQGNFYPNNGYQGFNGGYNQGAYNSYAGNSNYSQYSQGQQYSNGGQYSQGQQYQYSQGQQYSQQFQYTQQSQYNQSNVDYSMNVGLSQMQSQMESRFVQMEQAHRDQVNKVLEFGRNRVLEFQTQNKTLSDKVDSLQDSYRTLSSRQTSMEKNFKKELEKRDKEIKRLRDELNDKKEERPTKKAKTNISDKTDLHDGDSKVEHVVEKKESFVSRLSEDKIKGRGKGTKDLNRMRELLGEDNKSSSIER